MSSKAELLALIEALAGKATWQRKDLAIRYGKSLRTIDEWRAQGTLPKPFYLPGCPFPFWRPIEVIQNEKRTAQLSHAYAKAQSKAKIRLCPKAA